ncbi:hypothetical protein M407DRAFT_14496 [Tulasnella calospora MUT 4182]|uniref:ABC transporter n=1 Tax=Tulasnella calospora MUT 4182 TaxID=1051891 RepID=A0A0C3QQ34_9AGAM|nr:hypothetical protein M407DRAFT_14496 [Tulasnella calospora MUT 4182]
MAPSRDTVLATALAAVRFFGPAILCLIDLSLTTLNATDKTGQTPGPIVQVTVPVIKPRRSLINLLLSVAALSYLFDGTVVVLRAVFWKTWEGASSIKWNGIEVADVLGLIAFGALLIIGTWKDAKDIPVWTSKRVKTFAVVGLLFEAAHTALLGVTARDEPPLPPPHTPETPIPPGLIWAPFLHISLSAFRLLVLIVLVPVLWKPVTTYIVTSDRESSEATAVGEPSGVHGNGEHVASESTGEASGLLAPIPKKATGQYGTFLPPPSTAPSIHSSSPGPSSEHNVPIKPKPIKEKAPEDASWRETFTKLRRLLPYLWPHNNVKLQFLASLCMVILLIARVINILLPLTLRQLVLDLDRGVGFPLMWIFAYGGLRFVQGSGGLNALRDVLWAPVMQYSDREMSQLSFDHLLNLSLAFHTKRKTGEVLRILDRGAAINHVFEVLLFNIIPTLIDIVVALGAFFYFFGWTMSILIAGVMISYTNENLVQVLLTQWRTKLRRAMNDKDIITRGIHTDCLLNYDTVKYFGGEQHEGERYRKAIEEYQALEYKVIASLNLLNFIQNLIISVGLLVGSLIVAHRIVYGPLTAADFVFFITYLVQLYGPLNMLGYIYRTINQNLVDTEKLLNLLAEPTEVNDKPGAPELEVTDGVITFENVNFSYDNKTTALHDVNFTIPKGHSLALVGESGGGKSTILRLLFRQYDLKEGQGRILIDGQDIRDVTQASLRKAIGVVPQDSVLFNATIGYNIGYGKFGSSQEEIETAAAAAQMHDRIVSFPDGYDTKVGERGVRLSGGEKQRVSIARTFLKNPKILALDEATSALDTATEKDIQKALLALIEGRTSISIAHRLSTISTADIILVLKDGQVVESGSHKELLAQGGYFAAMWQKQISSDDDQGPFTGPSGDVKGFDYSHEVQPTDATVVPAPEVMPEPEQYPFLAPGPAMVPLPPTEAELQAAADAETGPWAAVEDAKVASVQAGDASIKESVAPSVQAPGREVISLADDAVEVTATPDSGAPPVAFPSAAPFTFPKSDDASSLRQSITSAPTSITFKNQEPPHNPTESKGDKEPKRKRISSQNLQRLARRISGRKAPGEDSAEVTPTPDVPSPDSTGAPNPVSPPVTFPSSPPLAFPSSDDSSSRRQSVAGGSITFKDQETSEGKTDKEGNLKRLATQNFQRFARRISISGRRSSRDQARRKEKPRPHRLAEATASVEAPISPTRLAVLQSAQPFKKLELRRLRRTPAGVTLQRVESGVSFAGREQPRVEALAAARPRSARPSHRR